MFIFYIVQILLEQVFRKMWQATAQKHQDHILSDACVNLASDVQPSSMFVFYGGEIKKCAGGVLSGIMVLKPSVIKNRPLA